MAGEEAIPKRISCVAVSILAIAVVFVVFRFTSVYQVYRHAKYYPEAESVADTVKALTKELDDINQTGVRRLLGTEEYRHLKSREIDIVRQPDEMMWFRANEMFDIGLRNDGRISWMIDGNRY
jgi:hypothetical protein